jgi:ribonucleoside-diphosphate reductase alpha chain
VNVSKNGTCKSNIDGLNRMISLALRSGTKVDEIIDQLKGITCAACTRVKIKGDKKIDGLSCPDIIAKALDEEYKSNTVIYCESKVLYENIGNENKCPDCGAKLQLTEGCQKCSNPDCFYSKCN